MLVFWKGRILKTGRKNSKGYPIVGLSIGNKVLTKTVHRLVAQAFIPNPHNYPMVRHLDDVPVHNWVENLAWGTQHDNVLDLKCWNCGAPYHKRPRWHQRKRKYAA